MSGFDFDTVKKALGSRDAGLLLEQYADDARITVVNQNTPPSRPFTATGAQEVETYWLDVCGREITHEVGDVVVGDGLVAYTETCRYDDGTLVVAANTLELRDGKIARQTIIETWDQ